jgi:adenylate kinase family enzyme
MVTSYRCDVIPLRRVCNAIVARKKDALFSKLENIRVPLHHVKVLDMLDEVELNKVEWKRRVGRTWFSSHIVKKRLKAFPWTSAAIAQAKRIGRMYIAPRQRTLSL